MMTLHKLSKIMTGYYLEWPKKNYYQNLHYPKGQWLGEQSYKLGLKGDVELVAFTNLMAGYSPDGSKALVQNAGKNHVPAWDMTLSAPKSFSILHAHDKYGIFTRIQKLAVKAALAFIEKKAAQTGRGSGGRITEKLSGFLAAVYAHYESRTLDPQTHTHCLILNLAKRNDGTWGTIDSKAIYQWKMAAGVVYRAELACLLRQEGYEIEADGDSFNIVGVPLYIRKFYSKRDEQITNVLKDLGAKTSASQIGEFAKQSTRQSKTLVPLTELKDRWKKELKSLFNFTATSAQAIQHDHPIYAEEFIDVDFALEELTHVNSTFKVQDLYHHIAKQAQITGDDANSISHTVNEVLNSEKLIPLSKDYKNNLIYTTKKVIEAEIEMIHLAKSLNKQLCLGPSVHELNHAIDETQTMLGHKLSEEQITALINACTASMLAIIQGSAGAGKSTSLSALRIAYENIGQKVKGACIAKAAADNLQKETKIESGTIAMLLSQMTKGKKPLKNVDVLIIDEAGQVGAIQMQSLLKLAKTSKTKIVLVGDTKQLDAIERGGVLRYLSRADVIKPSHIEIIRRQREPWACEAVMNLRDGKSEEAIKVIDENGGLNFASTYDSAISTLVKKWEIFTHEKPNKQAIVLAQRWKDVEDLSKQLRLIYQERGLVGQENIAFNCVVSNKPIKQEFSIGDKVRFSQNDYKLGVSNGTFATVKGIANIDGQPAIDVVLNNGKKVHLTPLTYQDEYGRFPLVHAYAMTVYSSQGITIDGDTFVFYNSHMDRANTYVAGSRHKDNCHWFFNSKEIDLSAKPNNEMVTHDERLLELAKFMKREQRSTLAIEHLTDIQNEKYQYRLNDIELINNNLTNTLGCR
jgi:conjugative relaxase-like TrwC/TraI family protein